MNAVLSTGFLDDLAAAYEGLADLHTDAYLPVLAKLFDQHRHETKLRSDDFVRDLQKVYSSEISSRSCDELLPILAAQLSKWRETTRERMVELVSKLPEEDPLRCPVSLFGAMDYGRLETAHTRALAWMLDPRKEHGFGDGLLRELLGDLSEKAAVGIIGVEDIWAEYPVVDGRLDIIVRGNTHGSDEEFHPWLLVIEAKVGAAEGPQQLARYDDWITRHAVDREELRIFLTPDGRRPEAAEARWTPMSFARMAAVFRKPYAVMRNQPGYHFLRYYIAGMLKDVCRWTVSVCNPELCDDPYSYVEYLDMVDLPEGLTA